MIHLSYIYYYNQEFEATNVFFDTYVLYIELEKLNQLEYD